MKCTSGKHEWTSHEDAVRCCTPYYRRVLVIRVPQDSMEALYHHEWEYIGDEVNPPAIRVESDPDT